LKAYCVVSDNDRELLEYNGFGSFEALWGAKLDWFEEPNFRRHGWSGVSQHVLKRPEGGSLAVFIKRQENHNFKSFFHPVRGLPTAYREYRNLCKLKEYGIPCADLVFYGPRNTGGQCQAILMTRSLTGYKSLEDSLGSIPENDPGARRALLASVAQTLRRVHGHHLRHSCLYAKHILVRAGSREGSNLDGPHEFDSVLIDLEKMRIGFPFFRLVLHDFDTLYRHWNRKDGDWETLVENYLASMGHGLLSRKLKQAFLRRGDASQTRFRPSESLKPAGRQLTPCEPLPVVPQDAECLASDARSFSTQNQV